MVLAMWSYALVLCSDPGHVSEDLSAALLEQASTRRVQQSFPGITGEAVRLLHGGDNGGGGDDLRDVVHHGPVVILEGAMVDNSSAAASARNAVVMTPLATYVQQHETKERQRQAWRREARQPSFGGLAVPDGLRVTYCSKCDGLRPPRAHHCAICARCVMKMDHHCPWVANCVGLRNYKAFLCYVGYAFCAALLEAGMLLSALSRTQAHALGPSSEILSVGFSLSVSITIALGMFIVMHGALVLLGSTTLEFHVYGPGSSPFSLGLRGNLDAVVGDGHRDDEDGRGGGDDDNDASAPAGLGEGGWPSSVAGVAPWRLKSAWFGRWLLRLLPVDASAGRYASRYDLGTHGRLLDVLRANSDARARGRGSDADGEGRGEARARGASGGCGFLTRVGALRWRRFVAWGRAHVERPPPFPPPGTGRGGMPAPSAVAAVVHWLSTAEVATPAYSTSPSAVSRRLPTADLEGVGDGGGGGGGGGGGSKDDDDYDDDDDSDDSTSDSELEAAELADMRDMLKFTSGIDIAPEGDGAPLLGWDGDAR
jgi:hypothetical protein